MKIQLTTPVLLRVVLVSMQIWPEGAESGSCVSEGSDLDSCDSRSDVDSCGLTNRVWVLRIKLRATTNNLLSYHDEISSKIMSETGPKVLDVDDDVQQLPC